MAQSCLERYCYYIIVRGVCDPMAIRIRLHILRLSPEITTGIHPASNAMTVIDTGQIDQCFIRGFYRSFRIRENIVILIHRFPAVNPTKRIK